MYSRCSTRKQNEKKKTNEIFRNAAVPQSFVCSSLTSHKVKITEREKLSESPRFIYICRLQENTKRANIRTLYTMYFFFRLTNRLDTRVKCVIRVSRFKQQSLSLMH